MLPATPGMTTMRHALGLLAVLLLAVPTALRPAAAQPLRIGMQAPPSTLDPHWLLNLANTGAMRNIYDSLTMRDPELKVVAGLAESWKLVDETTWEFKLRPGVTFHDGSPLTSADIVATFQRVPNVPGNPNPYTVYMVGIAGVDVIDDRTFRVRTNGPLPILPVNLAQIFVVPKSVQFKGNAEFNTGEAAIGTGPFRLASWSSNQPLSLRRNDTYWAGPAAFEGAIFTPIPNDTARVAALLAGDVDFINSVPEQDVQRLGTERAVTLFSGPSIYAVNIYPDIERANLQGVTDANGQPLADNPFRDARVRRALSLALPREAIARQIMGGLMDPSDQTVPPFVFGAIPGRAVPAQDLGAARALLAEAGWGQGFGITIFCSPSRTPRICQAIAGAWSRIGIRTTVEVVPQATFLPRRNRREFGLFITVFGSLTGEASYQLGSQIHSANTQPALGTLNFTGINFPELDQLVRAARTTLDDAARASRLAEIQQRVVDDSLIIGVGVFRSVTAGRAGLAYRSRADEEILAYEIGRR
jgi:peptide/nickel transport system substrate-binding protein